MKTVLIIIGAPLWIPILVAVFAVILSVYVAVWSVIIALWSIFVALIACVFGGIVGGLGVASLSYVPKGVALIGSGILCFGLAIFLFFGCKAVTKGVVKLTGKIALAIGNICKKEIGQ